MKKMLTIREVAELTGTKEQTWRVWLQKGKCPLKAIKINGILRFPAMEVEALVTGGTIRRGPGRPRKDEQQTQKEAA